MTLAGARPSGTRHPVFHLFMTDLSGITVTVEPSEELLAEFRRIAREEAERAVREQNRADDYRVDETLR